MSAGGPVVDRASFLRLIDSLIDTYTPEGVLIWLRSANRHFGDRTPLEVLRDEGWEPLIEEADRLAGGPTSGDRSSP